MFTGDHCRKFVSVVTVTNGPAKEYSFVRTFGNIFISFVGAGVLGLPYAFKMAGVVESCIILCIAGVLSVKAMLMIVECAEYITENRLHLKQSSTRSKPVARKESQVIQMTAISGSDDDADDSDAAIAQREVLLEQDDDVKVHARADADHVDYGDIGTVAYGDTGWWLVQASIVFSQIGFGCAYLIFIIHNINSMIPSISPNEVLVGCLLPLAVLANIRDLSRLGIFSLLADAANVFAYFVVFYFDFSKVEETGIQGSALNLKGTPFFLGVAIYCYEGAGMIIALSTSVPKEHRHKFPRVFKLALAVITALYMFFGASGYISYGNDTEKIITLNMPSGPFPNVVKGCLCFSLYFTYPVMMFPVSTMLDKVLSGTTYPDGLPIHKGALLRSGLVGLSGIVVLAIPDFATIMGLIGSTCCMLLALILPGIFHLQIYAGKLSIYDRMFDYGIIALGMTGSILGTMDALDRIFAASTDDAA